MSKGGGTAPSQQTVVNRTEIPDWQRAPIEDVTARATAVANRPYTPYQGPRIAGFNADQNASFDMARGLGSTYQPMFTQGTQASQQAMAGFQNAGNYAPGQFQADQVGAGQWNSGVAQQYMNPYLDNVLRRQEGIASERFQADQRNRDLARANAGTFGGFRHRLVNEYARGNFNRSLDDIAAGAYSSAYDRAYQGFAGDRDALMRAGIANQGANLEAQRMGEQSRQFGANLGLQGAQGLAGIGDQLYRQGALARDYAGRDLDAMRSIGQQQQDQVQRNYDLGYSDFVNQRDWDRNNIGFLSGIIRGNPVTPNSDTTTYSTENPYSNMLGLGIGAAGLYKAFQSGAPGVGGG